MANNNIDQSTTLTGDLLVVSNNRPKVQGDSKVESIAYLSDLPSTGGSGSLVINALNIGTSVYDTLPMVRIPITFSDFSLSALSGKINITPVVVAGEATSTSFMILPATNTVTGGVPNGYNLFKIGTRADASITTGKFLTLTNGVYRIMGYVAIGGKTGTGDTLHQIPANGDIYVRTFDIRITSGIMDSSAVDISDIINQGYTYYTGFMKYSNSSGDYLHFVPIMGYKIGD